MKLDKKNFIKKFIKEGSSIIWPKEMRMVNTLFKIFPNQDFWNSLKLNFKFANFRTNSIELNG